MKFGKNIWEFATSGYSNFPEPGRVIFKTIVSSEAELPYVLMNLQENLRHCDYFLICEANRSVLGEPHDFVFESLLAKFKEFDDSRIIYIKEDISDLVVPWNNSKANLFANAFAIRDGFRKIFPILPSDIVISTDGDEVLFGKSVGKLIRRLRRRNFQRMGYQLRLNQVVYKLEYLWQNCGFRAPVVSRAEIFLNQRDPQWRDTGTSTYFKKGTHFSWIMTPEEILEKVLSTAHRVEYEHCADINLIRNAFNNKIWIFQPERPFKIIEQKNPRSRVYPRSLSQYLPLLIKYTDAFLKE